ncbi:MAG TPA: LptF/LptG family permease [Vicinamibacterales bacterium]|nr:LptF/LptG family permease [Vicinamibacterales bacterium]
MLPRIIDRYVIREVIPPFLLALLVFTFVLIIPFIIDLAETMIAKGVPAGTILQVAITLLPQALALTIPMSLLIGLLVGLGRLSADREFVVMMACGISPYRLLQPILVFAVVCWGLTSWVMLKAMPDGNQAYREITTEIIMNRAEGEVRPRVFFEDFPNVVLYVHEVPANGQGWIGVLAADTSNASAPVIYLAERGPMVVDRHARTIDMVLEKGTRHRTQANEPKSYEVAKFERTILSLNPESVFPRTGPARGERELGVDELAVRAKELEAQGISPHNPIMEIHKKFSVPVACFVFAILGLALGASNRKDGKLAAFVLGIAVIFAYYVIMFTAQSLTKGFWVPAWLSMWIPNIILGVAGIMLLISRARSADQPIRVPLPAFISKRLSDDRVVHGAAHRDQPRPRPVLVIRIPHFELPRPTLLDSYVAKQYLRILAMTTIGMLGLFYISTFIDLSDKLFKGQTSLGRIGEFLFWSTPQFLSYIVALAVLLSALVTIGLLTKNSELIVMRACGVSLYRTALPMVAFALGGSAFLWGLSERVLASANQRAERLRYEIRTGSPQTFGVLNRKWIVGTDGEVYHYQYYDPRTQMLHGLSVFEFDRHTNALTSRMHVNRAAYAPTDGKPQWLLDDGWIRTFDPQTQLTPFEQFGSRLATLEAADYFVTEAREPDLMNFGQLREYIRELRASGYNVLDHEVGLHRKVAFPFVTLVMTLIAVPFAVTTGRRGAMYGVGVGIVLALVYWTMISIFAAFGQGGLIDPMLAAWAPNLVFGAAAAYLLLTVRT